MLNDSGYYKASGALPTLKATPLSLKDFEATDVKYVEVVPAPTLSVIDKAAEVGVGQPDYYRRLVDSARGALGQTKKQIFDDLNSKWAAARAQVG